jgi:hypothetical protein
VRDSSPAPSGRWWDRSFRCSRPLGVYVSNYSDELAFEGVALALLHASAVARAIELAAGRRLRQVSLEDLDAATHSEGKLADEEPALARHLEYYIAEDSTIGGAKRPTALRVLTVVARHVVVAGRLSAAAPFGVPGMQLLATHPFGKTRVLSRGAVDKDYGPPIQGTSGPAPSHLGGLSAALGLAWARGRRLISAD